MRVIPRNAKETMIMTRVVRVLCQLLLFSWV